MVSAVSGAHNLCVRAIREQVPLHLNVLVSHPVHMILAENMRRGNTELDLLHSLQNFLLFTTVSDIQIVVVEDMFIVA